MSSTFGEEPRRRKPKNTSDISDVVEKLYKEGVPVMEIAKQLGVSLNKIYKTLDRLEAMGRIKKRRSHNAKHRRLTKEELEQIKKLYKQGASIYEIAKRLDRPVSTIAYTLKKLRLK